VESRSILSGKEAIFVWGYAFDLLKVQINILANVSKELALHAQAHIIDKSMSNSEIVATNVRRNLNLVLNGIGPELFIFDIINTMLHGLITILLRYFGRKLLGAEARYATERQGPVRDQGYTIRRHVGPMTMQSCRITLIMPRLGKNVSCGFFLIWWVGNLM